MEQEIRSLQDPNPEEPYRPLSAEITALREENANVRAELEQTKKELRAVKEDHARIQRIQQAPRSCQVIGSPLIQSCSTSSVISVSKLQPKWSRWECPESGFIAKTRRYHWTTMTSLTKVMDFIQWKQESRQVKIKTLESRLWKRIQQICQAMDRIGSFSSGPLGLSSCHQQVVSGPSSGSRMSTMSSGVILWALVLGCLR